nr:App1 family protein [Deinobacterium chartae]
MLRLVLLHNAYTRLPFEGVASFYAALERGTGEAPNPIFYVSSSPWNLYDLLEDFLEHQGIPAGPLLLKDWSLWNLKAHTGHKLGYIRRLLEAYPRLPFVLIGDSGERDPEIYLEAVRKHPGRFRAVYIRDVVGGVRAEVVRKIAAEVEAMGVPMLLVSDTVEAARHAESLGLILPQQVEQVAEGAQREAEKPSPLEVALGEGETRDP